jgi:hypothetical protein
MRTHWKAVSSPFEKFTLCNYAGTASSIRLGLGFARSGRFAASARYASSQANRRRGLKTGGLFEEPGDYYGNREIILGNPKESGPLIFFAFLKVIKGVDNESDILFVISCHFGKKMPTLTMKKHRGDQRHFWSKIFIYPNYSSIDAARRALLSGTIFIR